MIHNAVIIVAGGIGSRMKSDKPKQFLELCGHEVIAHTIKRFLDFDSGMQVIICVHKNYKVHLEQLILKEQFQDFDISITIGGETRYHSVSNGLKLINERVSVIGVHDAARPLVNHQTIAACYTTALAKGNAVPCIGVSESIRKISNNINVAVNRNEYRIVQTPQVFQADLIKKAFEQGYSPLFTDDATVLESAGHAIHLVEGNPENIKLTSPHDMLLAEAMLKNFTF